MIVWKKLSNLEIMCTIVLSMYSQVQSVVCTSRGCTEQIQRDKGVRQGCPLAFDLYINDRDDEWFWCVAHQLECERPNAMYADDVALVAESGADLQNMLDSLSGY